ncbi:restriction endonuclease subunit S [Flavobacterium columnare]|uniref:restriction endonuclease subunit S n=1 Tax=Flavobacterium columnare TaxID=996 RepID=UPI004033C095
MQAKKLNKIKQNQFIYSRLGANNGSFAMVKDTFNNYYVSNEFPTFEVNNKLIQIEYLEIIFKLPFYWKIISNQLQGAAHKRFKEALLLNIEIPLPSIEEQNKIVASYNTKLQLAQQQEEQAKSLETEIEKYLFKELGANENKDFEVKTGLNLINYSQLSKWALSHLSKDNLFNFERSKYKTEKIKNLLIFFEGGKTPSKASNDYWKDGKIFWTTAKDFNSQYMNSAQDKITLLAVKEAKMKIYPKGVFLSVFRSGILQHSFPTALTTIETSINQDLKAYQLKEELIDKIYYLHFVSVFRKYILIKASKKSVTVESINTEDFLEIDIPLPPLEKQKQISNYINSIKAQINELNVLSVKNKEEAIVEFEKEIFS